MDHIVNNAAEALLELVNMAARVCKEHGSKTGLPANRTIAELRMAYRVAVAAFGLVPTGSGDFEEPGDNGQ